jgi:hypothetical protein
MKTKLISGISVVFVMALFWACSKNELTNSNETKLTDLAQTSGQLASGTSFTIIGSSSSTANGLVGSGSHGGGRKGGRGGARILEGTNFITADDALLAIVDAESAGDFRGLRMHEQGGATITHYDAAGNTVTLPEPDPASKPEGCSFSGKQFPKNDSLLSKIAKTVIDFASGVTNKRGDNTITRSGKIIINRTGDSSSKTEIVTYENYKVNGIQIEGTKTRVSTLSGGVGNSSTNVTNGKITFADGRVATWESSKKRVSNITVDANGKPVSGKITTEGVSSVKLSDGSILFSNSITSPVTEDVSCGRGRHSPVSGTVTTVYKTDTVVIDFGDGSCSNTTVTVTINGVVSTKTIGR